MKTKLTASAEQAAIFISKGELVAFPTETVYGLGANVFDAVAIKKIFDAKGRPSDNPLIVHIAHHSELDLLAHRIPDIAQEFIHTFFPGPLTLVLPKSKFVPDVVSAGLKTVAVRMPSHSVAQAFLRAAGVSIAAPSANLSGKPSATSWHAVKQDLDGKISCILKGGDAPIGLESTVVDCTGKIPLVLRTGAISLEQLQTVNAQTKFAQPKKNTAPKSPGMKYAHYAPSATVILIDSVDDIRRSTKTAYIGLTAPTPALHIQKICRSIEEYAHSVFSFFRDADAAGVAWIYCECVPEHGIGRALMDRLRKASEKS